MRMVSSLRLTLQQWRWASIFLLVIVPSARWWLLSPPGDPRFVGHWVAVRTPNYQVKDLYKETEYKLNADGTGATRWGGYPGWIDLKWRVEGKRFYERYVLDSPDWETWFLLWGSRFETWWDGKKDPTLTIWEFEPVSKDLIKITSKNDKGKQLVGYLRRLTK